MAEHKDELVLRLNCKDGKLYGNSRYLRIKSKLIRSLEKSTEGKCKVLDVPFRTTEVKAFLDLCDQVGTDEGFAEYLKQINYIEFVRMIEWFDLGDYGHNIFDGMFFSGANYPQFWQKCKQCYSEHFEETNTNSSSDADESDNSMMDEQPEKSIYDYLPQIFAKLEV